MKDSKEYIYTYLLSVLCLFVISCTPAVSYIQTGEPGAAKSLVAPIDVYLDEHKIPMRARVIGEVRISDTGLSVGCGYDSALSIIKDKAREVGADGVYLARVQEPDISSTCYRVTARMIKYSSRETLPQVVGTKSSGSIDPSIKWSRAIPESTEIIPIGMEDFNSSQKPDGFERAADAVATITGSRVSGTAFLITRDGLAVTNNHVVEDQVDLNAKLRDGKIMAVRVLRTNPNADVALIQIYCPDDCFTLDVARINPKIGREVHVIGSPLNLNYTLTTGIVSGVRLSGGVTLVQTDAALNSGNSGGPMIDVNTGKVMAVVSWKVSGNTVEGLGFGVAIQDALRVLGVQWQ